MESLTARILRFQRTGDDREAIIRDISCRIYEYPKRRCRWDEETSSEFFARVFPKIQGLIERFRDVGRPFESYLASVLTFQVRTFVHDKRLRDMDWQIAAAPELWEQRFRADEEDPWRQRPPDGGRDISPGEAGRPPGVRGEPEPCARGIPTTAWDELDPALKRLFDIGADGRVRSETSRRRFLISCLKSAHLLSDRDVEGIARVAGVLVEPLRDAVLALRARQLRKASRVALFTERRNRAFHELMVAETALLREVDESARGKLEQRRARLKRTMACCQRIIARIRLAPSHREIADVLHMPKASVDSTVHRLKRRAATIYPDRNEELA